MTKPVQPPKPDFLGRGARKPFDVHEVRRQMELHPERLVPAVLLDAGFTVEDWAEWEALQKSPYEPGDIIAVPVIAPDHFAREVEAGGGGTPITVGGAPGSADQFPSHPTAAIATVAAVPSSAAVSKKHHGRKPGEPVDAGDLKRLRGTLSQEELAEKCGDVSLATIQRGEAGDRWDRKTFIRVAETLTLLTGQQV